MYAAILWILCGLGFTSNCVHMLELLFKLLVLSFRQTFLHMLEHQNEKSYVSLHFAKSSARIKLK